MKQTLTSITRLQSAGMLSEAARREVERKLMEIPEEETSEKDAELSFG